MKRALLLVVWAFLACCQAPAVPITPTVAPVSKEAVYPPEWLRYESAYGGFSFAYPPGSVLETNSSEPLPGNPPLITLYLPAHLFSDGNVMSVHVHNWEIEQDQSLEEWVGLLHGIAELPRGIEKRESLQLTMSDGDKRPAWRNVVTDDFGSWQEVYLQHGRLVISVEGPDTEAMAALLPVIAASIVFAPSAPTTLNELYGTHEQWISLKAMVEQSQKGIPAGSEPDIVSQDAAAEITPSEPPTVSPDFLTQEAYYAEALATAEASAALTPPTSTPIPVATGTPIPSDRPGFALFIGSSIYQETPLFQVEYDTGQWQLEDFILRHRQLTSCALNLTAGGRGAAGPMVVEFINFGGFDWRVTTLSAELLVAYALEQPQSYYLMTLDYPANADAAVKCRAAADAIVDTFALAP